MPTQKLTPQEFAASIKAKYPDSVASDGRKYVDIPDEELTRKVVAKYPVYESKVALPTYTERVTDNVKKAATDIGKGFVDSAKNVMGNFDAYKKQNEGADGLTKVLNTLVFAGHAAGEIASATGKEILGAAKAAASPLTQVKTKEGDTVGERFGNAGNKAATNLVTSLQESHPELIDWVAKQAEANPDVAKGIGDLLNTLTIGAGGKVVNMPVQDAAAQLKTGVMDLVKGAVSTAGAVKNTAVAAKDAVVAGKEAIKGAAGKIKNTISPNLEPLAKEAQKYNSAEEFVKSQQLSYHGSTVPIKSFNNKTGVFFTDDMMNADGYGNGENVYEGHLNLKNPLIIDAKERRYDNLETPYGKSTTEIVKNVDSKKYDGVIFKNIKDSFDDGLEEDQMPGTISYAFRPKDAFLNESQLIDFYNKSKGGGTLQATIEAVNPAFKGKALEGAYEQVVTKGRTVNPAGLLNEQTLAPSEQAVKIGTRLNAEIPVNGGKVSALNLTGKPITDLDVLHKGLNETEKQIDRLLSGTDAEVQYTADKLGIINDLQDIHKNAPLEFQAIKESGKVHSKVVEFAGKTIAKAPDTIKGLRDARIKFDFQARKEFPSAFAKDGTIDTKTPAGRAIKDVRDAINEHLYNSAPEGSELRALIQRESDIFRASKAVSARAAAGEGKNAYQLWRKANPGKARILELGATGVVGGTVGGAILH